MYVPVIYWTRDADIRVVAHGELLLTNNVIQETETIRN